MNLLQPCTSKSVINICRGSNKSGWGFKSTCTCVAWMQEKVSLWSIPHILISILKCGLDWSQQTVYRSHGEMKFTYLRHCPVLESNTLTRLSKLPVTMRPSWISGVVPGSSISDHKSFLPWCWHSWLYPCGSPVREGTPVLEGSILLQYCLLTQTLTSHLYTDRQEAILNCQLLQTSERVVGIHNFTKF